MFVVDDFCAVFSFFSVLYYAYDFDFNNSNNNNVQTALARTVTAMTKFQPGPDYGMPCRHTTSKGPTKVGCKIFEHALANQSPMFYAS